LIISAFNYVSHGEITVEFIISQLPILTIHEIEKLIYEYGSQQFNSGCPGE